MLKSISMQILLFTLGRKQTILNNILQMSQSKAEALGVSRSRFQGIKQRIRENGDLNLNTSAVRRLIQN